MTSDQAQASSDPIKGRPFSPGLRYSTCCGIELELNKQSTMSSSPVQEYPNPITSRPSGPGLRYSTSCDIEPSASNHQQEPDSFCGIPLHVLSTLQNYFLTTVPPFPGKIISINLVSESSTIHSSPSALSSTSRMEELAIPDHILQPLQEFFSNRRTNPEQFPKYVGVRITQEDARLYENVLGCCERGCLDEVILAKEVEGASEEVCQDACEIRAEGSDEIVGRDSCEESGGEVFANLELVSPLNSRVNYVEEEEGSAEEAPESDSWIMANVESG